MSFTISYTTTDGREIPSTDLLPNSTLAIRYRIQEALKEKILLLDKLETALKLVGLFVWEVERFTLDEQGNVVEIANFFSYKTAIELTPIEQQRQALVVLLKNILSNENQLKKMAKSLLNAAIGKRKQGGFVIPLSSDETHDYSSITDEAIALLIQEVVINDWVGVAEIS